MLGAGWRRRWRTEIMASADLVNLPAALAQLPPKAAVGL
jgi:hypothetical protein